MKYQTFLLAPVLGAAMLLAACGGTAAVSTSGAASSSAAAKPSSAAPASSVAAASSAAAKPSSAAPASSAAASAASPAAAAGNAANGKTLFASTCAACHGPDGKGLPGLGKDLTTSAFVKSKSDPDLVAFIKVGRPVTDPANTTHVAMPPKGGNPSLTDAQLLDIVAYIRTINK